MTDTVIWENARCEERGGFVERLTAVEGGVQYERIAPPDQQDVFPDLRTAPFPDVETVMAALPDLLDLDWDDEVRICQLPDWAIVEHLDLAFEGYEEEFELAGRWFVWRRVPLPAGLSPIAAWSNEDRYDSPGSDAMSALYRIGPVSVVDEGELGADVVGRTEDDDEAVRRWLDSLAIHTSTLREYLTGKVRDDVDREEIAHEAPDAIAFGYGLDAVYDVDALDEWWEWAAEPGWSADPAEWMPAHDDAGSFDEPLAAIAFDSGDWSWLHRVGAHYVHGGSAFDGPQYLGRFDATVSAFERWRAGFIRPSAPQQLRIDESAWVGEIPAGEA